MDHSTSTTSNGDPLSSSRGGWNPYRRSSRHNLPKSPSAGQLSSESLSSLTPGGRRASGSTSEMRPSSGFTDLLDSQAIASRKPLNTRSGQDGSSSSKSNGAVRSTSKHKQSTEDLNNTHNSRAKILSDASENLHGNFVTSDFYSELAKETISVGRFNKVAYPEMYGTLPPPDDEPLFEKKFGVQR